MTNLPKLKRAELPPGDNLCNYCTAKCCRYFALPLDKPKQASDWDYMRWFLLHEGATAFKEDDHWYLLMHAKCRHLQDDNRCGIYATRPQVCREYSANDCEYEDDWLYQQYLETPEQVEEYAEAILTPKGSKNLRGPKPALLPLL